MKPSERVQEILPQCVELWTEKTRLKLTTNSFAPSKEDFKKLLEGPARDLMGTIITEAYASAILHAMDQEHDATRKELNQLWDKLRELNGGPFPGDP